MLRLIWANIRRSWTHHAWLQVATISVLIATYAVVLAFCTIGYNLTSILTMWGDAIEMTVYLRDDISQDQIDTLNTDLKGIDGVTEVKFVSKQQTAEKFKMDMSGFMPEMLDDQEFSNPFPANFVIKFANTLRQKIDSQELGKIAKRISTFDGAEDISYGQDWIQNYAKFVSGINSLGVGLIILLLCGSVFVIGNAVKTSIFVRREEIEILELFGANKSYIRMPYIIEGAMVGFIASVAAVILISIIFSSLKDSVSVQSIFLAVKSQFRFLSNWWLLAFIFGGAAFGSTSSYFFVRQLNHGWLASRRADF